MKKILLMVATFSAVISIVFLGCKKDSGRVSIDQLTKQVTTFLDKQQASSNLIIADRIKNLRSNLNLNQARIEKLSEKENFIVVPIASTFHTAFKGANQIYNLLLILNEQGQIRKADIIQYVPTQPISQIPVGTYTKMYKTDMITCDGQFRFLTIAGKYLYEFNYSKGIMRNYKYMTTKTRSVTSTTLYGCVDWYEYTLSFDPNTGVTGIEYDYLYTVCQDDGCPPEDPTVAQSTLCGGTGGTGGDSGGEDFVNPADGGSGTIDYNGPSTDDNMALTAQKDWIVVQNTSGLWYIGSTERFNGVKNSIEIFGGHFTKITHLSSNVSAPGWTWQENSSVWFNSSDAYSSISGWLTDEHGGRDFIPTVTHDFTFNFVFP